MNVFFDYQIFYLQKYGGISRYYYELARELRQIEGCHPKIIAPFHNNNYLDDSAKDFTLALNPTLRKIAGNKKNHRQTGINEQLTKFLFSVKAKSVLHETYYTHRFRVKAPRVTTIHDMIYELYHNNSAEEKKVIADKKRAILEADCIIAVSENTKRDLLRFYPEVQNKTVVVYHGVDQSSHPLIEKYTNPRPYILYVGNRGWYKNFKLLLDVFAESKALNSAFDLICFGGGSASDEEVKSIQSSGLKGKVKFLSGNDELLISLYKGAGVLAYVSGYEGFGMPVLEAMALSCPVVCSNTSSLPEVYGNAACAIEPDNKQALLNGLETVLFNTSERTKWVNLGCERVKHFTWKKCAQNTFTLYKKLI